MEPSFKKARNFNNSYNNIIINSRNIKTITILISVTALIVLVFIRTNYPLLKQHSPANELIQNNNLPSSPHNHHLISNNNNNNNNTRINQEDIKITDEQEDCDIFTGEWIPNPDAPYYTNRTCWAIHEHQNCMKYGRPDRDFLKWKWKPDKCDLAVFNPYQFLDIMRDKSLAFVGDSVGRNQMQSMICLLSRVEYPIDVSPTTDEHFKRWKYVTYNFTLAYYWSPFLVRSDERDPNRPKYGDLFKLYLDEADPVWSTKIDPFDYIIINAGHWLTRTAFYYEQYRLVGCRYCQLSNVTDLPITYGYRRIFRTALKTINELPKFNGVVFLRTFAPSHFENGIWNAGGDCVRKRPWKSNEAVLDSVQLDMYLTQLEEFKSAQKSKNRKRLRLMDVTQAMTLRPDGHPSRYGHWANENVTLYNDCVHWCLPGPIDAWADFFMHMVKMEARTWYKERLVQQQKRMN